LAQGKDIFYKCTADVCEQQVLSGAYWLVRKAVVVLVFFESMNLVLERFSSIKDFTFHSFRRSSVSAAPDDGALALQTIDFFGWISVSRPHNYISKSEKAMNNMSGLIKPETVTSSSPTASLIAEVSSDPIAFLASSIPVVPAASSLSEASSKIVSVCSLLFSKKFFLKMNTYMI